MILEGVNFIVPVCVKMSKDEFIRRHIDQVWLDRDKKKRRQMLNDAYDIMNPPKEEQPVEESE